MCAQASKEQLPFFQCYLILRYFPLLYSILFHFDFPSSPLFSSVQFSLIKPDATLLSSLLAQYNTTIFDKVHSIDLPNPLEILQIRVDIENISGIFDVGIGFILC